MTTPMRTFWLLLLLVCLPTFCVSQCSHNGKSMTQDGWSNLIRQVCLGDDVESNRFPSRDGRKVLIADLHGFQLKINGALISWPEGRKLLTSESEVLWSPTSSAFFISDGFGLDGWKLKVYVVTDSHAVSREEINNEIVRRFRAEKGCSVKAFDPNVQGLGWSEDGALIFAFAQATVNNSCGQSGGFRGIAANLTGAPIRAFYSENEAKRNFHNLLPFNMR
jgi:hypothetical protein